MAERSHEEVEKMCRRRAEHLGVMKGGHYYLLAADAIRDLGVALASQIEITNTERAAKERAEAALVETRDALRELVRLKALKDDPAWLNHTDATRREYEAGKAAAWATARALNGGGTS